MTNWAFIETVLICAFLSIVGAKIITPIFDRMWKANKKRHVKKACPYNMECTRIYDTIPCDTRCVFGTTEARR
jgi:hypothetical protein